MITIRPVSDLRNKFPEIEKEVLHSGKPVFLTKNGYGTMVLLSLEQYSALTENAEEKLDEADAKAKENPARMTHDEVFAAARKIINEAL